MKAILIRNDAGHSLVWTDVPDPVPGEDEVLVKVEYAGVNRADLMQRAGNYPPPPGAPEWMGLEVSGTVAGFGKNAAERCTFRKDDRVCCLLGGGGYAEYVTVPWDMLMPVPGGCSMAEAAALPEAFSTAYLNLIMEGGLKTGDRVLITGGNSGLASVMIPMAKALGAHVTATVRGAAKKAAIRPLGADCVVDTRTEDLKEVLKEAADAGHPLDLAVDCVGGEEVSACFPYMAYAGRWIMIAANGGLETTVNLRTLYVKNIRLIGSTLRSKPAAFKACLMRRLISEMWPLVAEGRVKPVMFAEFPITDAGKAHALLSSSQSTGKVVLKVAD